MEELLFYTVDKNYIKYLSEFESHVSYNKDEIGHSRPYLGIVLKIENYQYFVPLYSYKEHYKKYKNNPSFFFVYDRKNNPLAIIKFSAMIPVPSSIKVISVLEYNKQDRKYKDLISAEYRYINSNKEEIYKRANSTLFGGKNLSEVCQMSLRDLTAWLPKTIDELNEEVRQMGKNILEEFMLNANALLSLGLGYLTLDRSSNTLSTGELQRVQLARTVRNRTTGVLYVLDEPSIGLHPQDVKTLLQVFQKLIDNGATIIVIEHDLDVIKNSDYIIDMGPEGGYLGGEIVATGTVQDIKNSKESITGRYL